ncbi:MAG: electron transport complex subunit RsxA [Clostridia bacterium]
MGFAEIMAISVSAILVENFVLVQFLGICPFLGVSKKVETAFGMGMAVTFVMAVASAVTYLVNLLLVRMDLVYMQTIAFILVIATLVQFVEMFLKKAMPALYNSLGIFLPLITTNCAVLGVAILNVSDDLNFVGSIVNGVAAAIGFTIAIVIFASVREKLEFSNPPKCFEGFPIALVSASLLAMAFMGFSGLSIG